MPILNWLNKEQSLGTSGHVPYRLLEPVKKYSSTEDDAGNILVQGDNLEALKALLPYYAGQIKCVFIDPPYNTRNAFEHYDDNLEHSQWLSMMYPRLELLYELLSDDGSLWVSIDDDEAHYLKVILDEIFGRKNFVANVVWEKKFSPQNDAKWLSDSHDHVLIYAKNKDIWRPNLLPRTEEMDKRYKNPDNDLRGPWTSSDLTAKDPFSYGLYKIKGSTGKIFEPGNNRHWLYSESKMKKMISDKRIWFGEHGKNKPRLKKFLSEVQVGIVSKTLWFRSEVGDNQEAKREVKVFDEDDTFSTPKPERLIQRVLTLATQEGDYVLDSFLGSGTTAAAAHKMNRRWIGVEMGRHAVTHCVPRMKKVIDGEQGGISKAVNWKGGSGFKFYRLGQTIFDENGVIRKDIAFNHLAAHVWFVETQTSLNKKIKTAFLGEFDKTGYYLLYNGILGDRSQAGGNVLTTRLLRELPRLRGPKVIYGELCLLSQQRLKREQIVFKQIPYDIKIRS
jgi:adenine-specific DNA-methyltransferase